MGSPRIRARLRAEGRALLDAVYPPTCRLCGVAAADGVACDPHRLALDDDHARCGLCARPLAPGVAGVGRWPAPPWIASGVGSRRAAWRRCHACRRAAPALGRLLVLGDYPGDLRPWVLALKGHRRPGLAELLASLLAERMAGAGWLGEGGEALWLVPVPCHPLRRLERGFDQVQLLGRALAPRIGARLAPVLERRRATPRQGEPGSGSRAANVAGAFRATRAARRLGRRVVLLDDVAGTGATLGECARVLRRAGVGAVGAVALGRGRG